MCIRDRYMGNLAVRENPTLKNMLEETFKSFQKVDKIIENDLERPFQTWVPLSANMVNSKEGIHYPMVDQLLSVVKENEDKIADAKLRRQRMMEDVKKYNHDLEDQDLEEGEEMDS
eukprot:TRINITY_DN1897_c0_g1_i5.p2 TRINITY_DN1897_c0_g1~~TRINITY_DN1897_c0_g1_i5.p2  ORF type:complete len:116 (+),score=31.97 TRINITY_DN1897_c0_g1_i5:65-412(+)